MFNLDTKLGAILDHPQGTLSMEKIWPGCSDNPAMFLLRDCTLRELAEYPQTNLSGNKLSMLLAELAEIMERPTEGE